VVASFGHLTGGAATNVVVAANLQVNHFSFRLPQTSHQNLHGMGIHL